MKSKIGIAKYKFRGLGNTPKIYKKVGVVNLTIPDLYKTASGYPLASPAR